MSGLLAESLEEEDSCSGESEWESEPYTLRSETEGESKEIAGRNGDEEIGNGRIYHERLDILNGAQGIREQNLCAVAELIDDEGQE